MLLKPSNAELAQSLDIRMSMQRKFWPLIIIGSGPAGLTASIFPAREGAETLVIESEFVGGNANFTGYLENAPGLPEPITGFEFSERLRKQADEYSCNAIVIATGSRYRNLDVSGEKDFIGSGVHFCASCDGPFYKGQLPISARASSTWTDRASRPVQSD